MLQSENYVKFLLTESFDFARHHLSFFLSFSFLLLLSAPIIHSPTHAMWAVGTFSSTVTFHTIYYRDSFSPKVPGSVGVQVGSIIALVEPVNVHSVRLSFFSLTCCGSVWKTRLLAHWQVQVPGFCQGKQPFATQGKYLVASRAL